MPYRDACAAALVVLVTAIAGCGEGSRDSPKASTAACVILANGNKLCGSDAKAWCEKFASDGKAPDAEEACRATGATLVSKEGLADEQRELDRQSEDFDRGAALLSVDRYERTAKRVAGAKNVLIARPSDNGVTVEVEWSHDDYDPPPAGAITKLCSALVKIDPDTIVRIEPLNGSNWVCGHVLKR